MHFSRIALFALRALPAASAVVPRDASAMEDRIARLASAAIFLRLAV